MTRRKRLTVGDWMKFTSRLWSENPEDDGFKVINPGTHAKVEQRMSREQYGNDCVGVWVPRIKKFIVVEEVSLKPVIDD